MSAPVAPLSFPSVLATRPGGQTWHLKGFDLFRELPPAALEELERLSRIRHIRRASNVYAPGESSATVYALRRGVVRLVAHSLEGREGTLALLKEGEIFGEIEAMRGGRRSHFATAHEDCLVHAIPSSNFHELMKRHPDFALKVMVRMGRRMEQIQSKILCLLFKSSQSRLSELLLELSAYCGQPTPAGTRLRYRFAHHELASLIGVARETVTLTLREFRRSGLILNQGRHIVLREPKKLAAIG